MRLLERMAELHDQRIDDEIHSLTKQKDKKLIIKASGMIITILTTIFTIITSIFALDKIINTLKGDK